MPSGFAAGWAKVVEGCTAIGSVAGERTAGTATGDALVADVRGIATDWGDLGVDGPAAACGPAAGARAADAIVAHVRATAGVGGRKAD